MYEAIKIAHPDKLFIDGSWRTPTGKGKLRLVNPATEAAFMEVAEAGSGDVDAAVQAARRAFDTGPWPRMSPNARAAKMRELADAIDRRAASIEASWTSQMGAPVWMARGSSLGASALLKYYAGIAENTAFEDVRVSHGIGANYAVVVKEAVGVVAAIVPWNGPLMGMIMKVAPALAAGCTVVMKPSPETPLEAFLVAEAAEEVGLPNGVLNLLPADRDVSGQLVSHPGIDKVAFTGSTAIGLQVAATCASRMARYTAEATVPE